MQQVNKIAIAQAFGRAARNYQQYNIIQKLCGNIMIVHTVDDSPGSILDAGCGPGEFSRYFSQKGWKVTALDLSLDMLNEAKRQKSASYYICGDIEKLPFNTHTFDLSWSNLVVQWCDDLYKAISELLRVTKPKGRVLFSTLGAVSLHEMQKAYDILGIQAPINNFMTFKEIKNQLSTFKICWKRKVITVYFSDIYKILKSFKMIGATHLNYFLERRPLTRQKINTLSQYWPYCTAGFPLTYEIIYGVVNGN